MDRERALLALEHLRLVFLDLALRELVGLEQGLLMPVALQSGSLELGLPELVVLELVDLPEQEHQVTADHLEVGRHLVPQLAVALTGGPCRGIGVSKKCGKAMVYIDSGARD